MTVKKYRALLINDLRQTATDPMLMASILGPVFLIFITRYVLGPLSSWTERHYDVSLYAHAPFIAIFTLTIIPVLTGSLAGLLMLDDRDEKMIAYFGATPLGRSGYFRYRLFLPGLLTLLMCGLYIPMSGIGEVRIESYYAVILLVLESPLIALLLAVFASNKVEGLALTKAASLLFAGPVLACYVPQPWTYLGAWIPAYWPAQSYGTAISDSPPASLGWFVAGLILHVWMIVILLRRFHAQAEQ